MAFLKVVPVVSASPHKRYLERPISGSTIAELGRRKPVKCPLDRPAFDAILPLEVGQIIEFVLGGPRDRAPVLPGTGDARPQIADHAEVLFHVGGDVKLAPRLERAFDVGHQRLGEDPAFLVSVLPPGVREIDMDRVEARRRDLGAPGTAVASPGQTRALARSRCLASRSAASRAYFRASSTPRKLCPGFGRGRVGEEQPLARPDLELDGMVVAEEHGQSRPAARARGSVER